jgi:glycosyltransferase involved in cell wall biosynthesis
MRILQLSTHTTLIPRHGGKLRSHHIGRVLEEAGFELRRLAFCFRDASDIDDEREPIIDAAQSSLWGQPAHLATGASGRFVSDYLATVAALASPSLLEAFDAAFRAAAPDTVLLEHPWTWPLIERLPEVRQRRVRVIYSSQNVETHLKRDILRAEGIEPAPGLLEGVSRLERGLVAHADAVVTCTAADARVFGEWGARRTIVAPNGGVRRHRSHLRGMLPRPLEPGHAYALVVGSAHPPNISGFLNLVNPWLPRLPPGQRVVIAGGAGPAIAAAIEEAGLAPLLRDRVVVLGVLDELALDCALANTRALMVPVEYGGGSNVKTAEALLSGRPVVVTPAALRGFELGAGLDGLRVAGSAEAFGAAVLDLLQAPHRGIPAEAPVLAGLVWEHTVGPLVGFLREAAAAEARAPAQPAPVAPGD